MVLPILCTRAGGGASGAGGALLPAVTGRGMVLPSLLVLSLPSGAGIVLVIVKLGSLVIGSPFIVHQSLPNVADRMDLLTKSNI